MVCVNKNSAEVFPLITRIVTQISRKKRNDVNKPFRLSRLGGILKFVLVNCGKVSNSFIVIASQWSEVKWGIGWRPIDDNMAK